MASSSDFSRRRFLKQAALAGAALAVPSSLTAAPFRTRPQADPVRVQGRVQAGGQGLSGVRVTDGVRIVQTGPDGRFTLPSTTRQPFAYLTLPAGYAIPQNDPGTARFYRPITPDANGTAAVQFDLQPLDGGDAQHAFFALADPQTEDMTEIERFHQQTVPDVRSHVQALDRPAFGVGCGDIMFDDLALFPEYERAVQMMGVPFFQVIGNHDLDFESPTDPGSARTFREYFGPTYYSFDRGAVHYVVLDDVFWRGDSYFGYLDDVQLDWLMKDLSYLDDGQPVVVFTHIPPLSTRFRRTGASQPSPAASVSNRARLYELLDPFDAHIIAGHTHESEHLYENGPHEHIIGAACGAWWSGPICYDGTPKGYAVYEVDGTDIRWRYQATGHDADHQMRLYPAGSDPSAPDEMVANVWDADDEWTIVWYEDGIRKGEMARRTGTDPLSEELHRGEDMPERRPWVDPVPTDHLFYAPVRADAQSVRVEATDRFGRTYSAALDEAMVPAGAGER